MPTSRPAPASAKLGEILTWYSDVEELKGEMERWRDSIPDSLQGSDKYSQVEQATDILEDAASTLEEGCDRISSLLEKVSVSLGGIGILDTPIRYTERKMYKGYPMPRWVRLANPCAALEAAMQLIEDCMEAIKKCLPEDQAEELDHHKKQVDDALSDLQGVEFPSMYG